MEVMPVAPSPAAHKEYYSTLVQQLRLLPGVSSASLVDNFVLDASTSYTGIDAPPNKIFSTIFGVMPGYFETIGARLREGRLLSEADYASRFRGVVINEFAARALFGSAPAAVGRELTRTGNPRPWVVLGVITDLRHKGPLNTEEQDKPQVFFPFEPTKWTVERGMRVIVRHSGRAGLIGQMRQVAQSVGPRVISDEIRSGDELFAERVITPRRRMVLLTLLGTLALVLALVGVFGTTAYAVTRRTAEIGLRLAVGARPEQVVRTILRDSAAPPHRDHAKNSSPLPPLPPVSSPPSLAPREQAVDLLRLKP
jgi:ABC-type antimicrobial peptide transport system permease subunit